ncbi:Transposable element Tcb2 transposase [Chionoecetes opilio]|uniref:Transposable element Tcb2 transposase n=1 Tax=Chionoecetes opilio TaxID=41210 RepID=A0A8J5CZJ0_CHIOP|nr:Transposable element Tcb2 transposase [Chionoecetes opilio]
MKSMVRFREESSSESPSQKLRPGRPRKNSQRGLDKLVELPKNLTVNQAVYLELRWEHLPDSFEITHASVFQQDGASAHTAKSVTQWLDDCMVAFIKDWPGNSPDLNSIDNVWHMVKKDLQGKDVSSILNLEKAISESWANIAPEHVRNLALSLPRRLQAVKKRKGHPTKY